MEVEILQDNKKYILMREIFNLVDPIDVRQKQIHSYFKKYLERKLVRQGKNTQDKEDLDDEEREEIEEVLFKIQGDLFYDADPKDLQEA